MLDVSGSMSAEDVKPTRLAAAQEAVRRFLDRVPSKYRVGLVTFSSEPFVASPLTHDRDLVLEGLQYGTQFGQGTAIGDALARSVEMLQPTAIDDGSGTSTTAPPPVPRAPDEPLSAILMLSDGAQTRGTLQPLEGAERARSYGIPVYTVALGTPNGVINRGGFSRPVPPDPVTLRQIAQRTGGEFFATEDESHLNAVYENLASRLGQHKEWRELSFALLGVASDATLDAAHSLCGFSDCYARHRAVARNRQRPGRGRPRRLRQEGGDACGAVTRTAPTAPTITCSGYPRRGSTDVVARVLPGVVNMRTAEFDVSKSEASGVVVDPRGII